MPQNATFWRNVGIIGALHVAVLVSLTRWSGRVKKPAQTDILWMDGGAAVANAAIDIPQVVATPVPPPAAETPPSVESVPEETEPTPGPTAAESEIQLPTPTAAPVETPSPTPRPTETPSVKPSPKPTPRPKPTPTPKAKPKKAKLAKASPKPTAKAAKKKPTPAVKKISVKPDPSPTDAPPASTAVASGAEAKPGPPGGGGQGSGPGGASRFGSYARMLHDRFFSEWVQPTTVVATGAKMSALVRVRIEKDGRVSNFEIVRPSGNVVVDESVAAVAKRVARVDPLPAGLGAAGYYEVKINFELSPEQ